MLSEDGALIDRRNIPSEGDRIERRNMLSPGVLNDLWYIKRGVFLLFISIRLQGDPSGWLLAFVDIKVLV